MNGESDIHDIPGSNVAAFVAGDSGPNANPGKTGVDEDAEARTELRKLFCGQIVANPGGCITMAILVIVFLAASGGIFYQESSLCLNASFSDFQVSGSVIVERYYIKNLLSDFSFQQQIVKTYEDSEDDSSRRLVEEVNAASNRIKNKNKDKDKDKDKDRRRMEWTAVNYADRESAIRTLYVFYYDPKGDNVLEDDKMELAHEIEQAIKSYDGYSDHSLLYYEDGDYYESAPDSFLNYLFPTVEDDTWILDGNGDTLCCDTQQTAIDLAVDYGIYDYFDFSFDEYSGTSKYVVSVFGFGRDVDESTNELTNWVTKYDDLLSKYNYNKLGVAYTDSEGEILYNQLIAYVIADLQLAAFSLCFIFVVVYIYVRSLWLTITGLIGVLASFVPSFLLYYWFYGNVFNIVNCVSIWVILGIGADDIFVFVASYRRAPLTTVDGRVVPNYLRMSFAYREAGAAMFCTSFTTACSFASLMFSTISPLPQFGFFMACLVLMNFLLVMTWFPCCLQAYIWFTQLFMLCGCKCNCPFLAVPVAIKKDKKDILHGENPKLENQSSWVVNQRQHSRC